MIRIKAASVAHFRHLSVKVPERKGLGDSFVHRLPCHRVPCGKSLLFRLVEGIGLFLPTWMFDNGEGIFPAQFIGTLTQQPQVGFLVVLMLSVHNRDGVDDNEVMLSLGV